MDPKTEKKFIVKIQEGDEEYFRKTYDDYHKQLYGLALKYLKSKELAEDAVHDVFIKLWNYRDKLDEEGSLKGFLFTSMKNHVLNMVRDRKRDIKKNKKYAKLRTLSKNSTEAAITYKNYKRVFEAGLEELPDGKREIFNLKMEKGFSNKKVAEKLDISVNTVKSQYYKASKFIKSHLSKHTELELE